MKVQKSYLKKLLITQVEGLDPVSVYLENYGLGAGKLTIECYGECWSHYWGSMGSRNLEAFILDADNHYISKKLATLSALSEPDYEAFIAECRSDILKQRREHNLTQEEAAEAWEACGEIEPSQGFFDQLSNFDVLSKASMCNCYYELFEAIPDKDSQIYKYLCKILDVAREAIKQDEAQG